MPLPAHQKLFSIGEASSILNVSADTLRRSEKKGKVKTKRGKNNERLYSLDDVILLKGILKKRLPTQKMYSVKQTANLLNVSSQTIRRWEREGRIKAVRSAGGHRRFTQDSIQAVKDKKYQQVQKLTKDITPPQQTPISPTPYQPNFPVFKLISFATIGTLLVGFIILSLNSGGNIKSTFLKGIGNKIGKILPGYETDYKYEGNVKIEGTVTIAGIIEFLDSPHFTQGAVFGSSTLTIDNTGNLTTDQTITANSLAIVGAADMYRLNLDSSLTVAGNEIINSSGKIPALNGYYFENLSGENITNVDAHHLGGQAASSFLRSNEPDTAEAVLTFTASPGSVDVNGGPLYINPSASSTNYTLFGVAVDGVSKFKVDTEGDISLTGSIASTGARVIKGWFTDLEVTNTPTFGGIPIGSTFLKLDASNDPITGDLLLKPTSNSTTTLQVQKSDTTPVFNVDTTNGRVGIGTDAPVASLDIQTAPAWASGWSKAVSMSNAYMIEFAGSSASWGVGASADKLVFYDFTNTKTVMTLSDTVATYDVILKSTEIQIFDDGGDPRFLLGDGGTEWGGMQWNSTGNYLGIGIYRVGATSMDEMVLDTSGNFGVGNLSPQGRFHITGTADDQQLIVQAHSSQTANTFELQNSSSAVLASFTGFDSTTAFQINKADTTNVFNVDTTNGRVGIGTTYSDPIATVFTVNGKVRFRDGDTTNSGTFFLGTEENNYFQAYSTSWVLNRSFDLFDIRKSNVTQLRLDANGKLGLGTTVTPTAMFHLVGNADIIQTVIKANAAQSANLTEWQNSSANVLSGVDERGVPFADMNTVASNTFYGSDAGNSSTSGTGSNTGIGVNALAALTTGYYNTAVGWRSLDAVTEGYYNVGVGTNALTKVTEGHSNVGIGQSALQDVVTGILNVAVGKDALKLNTGSYNMAVGGEALAANVGGHNNMAIGYRSLYTNVSGTYNTAIGTNALYTTTASNNTAIGYYSSYLVSSGANNITIGYLAGQQLTTESNILIIDSQSRASAAAEITDSILYGVMAAAPTSQTLRVNALTGINTTPSYALDVLASGTGIIARFNSGNNSGCTLADGGTISCTSDAELKTNIEDLSPTSLSRVLDLHPVAFDWKSGSGDYKSLGFLAHEVESIFPGLVSEDSQTGYLQLNTISLVPVLTRAIQEQQNQINSLASQSAIPINTSNNENESENLDTRVSDLEARILLLESDQVLGESNVATSSSSFLNSLAVLGDSVLGDTVITGKLDVGILSFDNLSGSIDAIGKLKLQSLALDSIEFLGGSIEMNQKGNLDIKKGVLKGNDSFRGSVTLVSGEMSIAIERSWEESPASVTATPNYNTNIWVTDKTDKGFIIHVDKPSQTDQAIDWLAIW